MMAEFKAGPEFWDSVPTIDGDDGPRSAGRRPSAIRAELKQARPERRIVLKTMGVLGGALALNVLSWLPPGRRASAARGTEYFDCARHDYGNHTAICIGYPYSRDYCGGDGWFLQYSGTCFASGPVKLCGSGGLPKENAWRWPYNGVPYRCADGFRQWCGGSGYFICSWSHPT